MQHAILPVAAIAAVLLTAAYLVVWSRRDLPRFRGMSIALALLSSVGAGVVVLSTLGHAVPLIGGITAPAEKYAVLSARAIKDVGIYITIDLPGAPRLFWLPWNTKMAEGLQEMMTNPGNAGVLIDVPPFEWSWSLDPPSFDALPQPKVLPDKPVDTLQPPPPRFSA